MFRLINRATSNRIDLIDGLRGFAIVMMVLHHFGYDLVNFAGVDSSLIENPIVYVLQPLFIGLFMLISGVCCRFSHSNIKRGIRIFACGLAVTAVTWAMDIPAWFGILHFLGLSSIICGMLQPYIDRIPARISLPLFAALYILSELFTEPYVGSNWFSWLGFRSPTFESSDYFPIFPWIFITLIGLVLGKYVVERRLPDKFYTVKFPFFAAVGRNTLLVYMLHQPVLYSITLLIRFFMP
jgi:uncharacterized membrane protein